MLDLNEWEFVNDFVVPVLPHDLCGGNKLRIILDRPGLATNRQTREKILGYSMLVEAWKDERKISEARTVQRVVNIHTENPQASIVEVALAMFPDSAGNPLKLKPPELKSEPEVTKPEPEPRIEVEPETPIKADPPPPQVESEPETTSEG